MAVKMFAPNYHDYTGSVIGLLSRLITLDLQAMITVSYAASKYCVFT